LINGCDEDHFSGNITLLFGRDRTPERAQISRTVEQIDFFAESVALAFFDDPIIDEVAYEKGFIEPICLDENPGTRFGPFYGPKLVPTPGNPGYLITTGQKRSKVHFTTLMR